MTKPDLTILYYCNKKLKCGFTKYCGEPWCALTSKKEHSVTYKDKDIPDKAELKKNFKKYGKSIWIEKIANVDFENFPD